ncbi:hypothetical protein D3C76_804820 [compost metagenome]
MDVRIQQCKQRQPLVNVPRLEAPGFLVQQRFLVQVEQDQFLAFDALDPADEALLIDDELVDVDGRQVVDQLYPVPGAAVVLAGIDGADPVPEGAFDVVVAA